MKLHHILFTVHVLHWFYLQISENLKNFLGMRKTMHLVLNSGDIIDNFKSFWTGHVVYRDTKYQFLLKCSTKIKSINETCILTTSTYDSLSLAR